MYVNLVSHFKNCEDSLVDVEGMVGFEQYCNIPPCPHHYLLHAPRVFGDETAHIIHLSVSKEAPNI